MLILFTYGQYKLDHHQGGQEVSRVDKTQSFLLLLSLSCQYRTPFQVLGEEDGEQLLDLSVHPFTPLDTKPYFSFPV